MGQFFGTLEPSQEYRLVLPFLQSGALLIRTRVRLCPVGDKSHGSRECPVPICTLAPEPWLPYVFESIDAAAGFVGNSMRVDIGAHLEKTIKENQTIWMRNFRIRPSTELSSTAAGSDGGRNTCLKFTRRGLESYGLSRSLIQAQLDQVELRCE
jgi:hypothetical protein